MKSKSEVDTQYEEIRKNGYWFWTEDLRSIKSEDKLLLQLKTSQSKFIELLKTESQNTIVKTLTSSASPIPLSLAITHIMRATDGSAELLDRVKDYIVFKKLSTLLIIDSKGKEIVYNVKSLNNFTKKLSNKEISKARNGLAEDILTLLLFGSQIKELVNFISFRKLNLGKIIGNTTELDKFFSSLYLDVSRQSKGISSAASGSIPQEIVSVKLQSYFSSNKFITKVPSSRIPGIGPGAGQQFDSVYVIERPGKNKIYIAIEIAFQETTNSVIERKSKQAVQLFPVFKNKGHYLCFVVDGAGYFSRIKALKDIIGNSHLCVTFQKTELDKLCKFIEKL